MWRIGEVMGQGDDGAPTAPGEPEGRDGAVAAEEAADRLAPLIAAAADAALGRLAGSPEQSALDAAAEDGFVEVLRRLRFGLGPTAAIGADAASAAMLADLADAAYGRAWVWVTVTRRVERRLGRRTSREREREPARGRASACPEPCALAAQALAIARAPDPAAACAADPHLARCASCRGAALTAGLPAAPPSVAQTLAAARLNLRAREGRFDGDEPREAEGDDAAHAPRPRPRGRAATGPAGGASGRLRLRRPSAGAAARLVAAIAILALTGLAALRAEREAAADGALAGARGDAAAPPLAIEEAAALVRADGGAAPSSGQVVEAGALLAVAPGAPSAALRLAGQAAWRLAADARVQVHGDDAGVAVLELRAGTAEVAGHAGATVRALVGALAVQALDGVVRATVDASGGRIEVLAGVAAVAGPGGQTSLGAGEALFAPRPGP